MQSIVLIFFINRMRVNEKCMKVLFVGYQRLLYILYIDNFKFRSKSMYLQNGALSPISLGVLNSADLFAKGTGKFLLN